MSERRTKYNVMTVGTWGMGGGGGGQPPNILAKKKSKSLKTTTYKSVYCIKAKICS